MPGQQPTMPGQQPIMPGQQPICSMLISARMYF